MSTNGSSNPPTEKPVADQPSADLSKDQVGWYFVEQYYNTVSKSPEKLHLFYGKKSQFVYGAEAQIIPISVGRQSIQERIKSLDFQDCKVRISNVDTQSSYDNIVIQVIGEFSNKGETPKKFVQTFVLAQQPSGYFVLNDILRCLDDDDEEEEQAAEPQKKEEAGEAGETGETGEADEADEADEAGDVAEDQAAAASETAQDADEPIAEEATPMSLDTGIVDKKLERVSETQDEKSTPTDSTSEAPESTKGGAPEPAEKAEVDDADATARQIAEEDVKEPERPKDPSPTPISKAPTAEPEKPAAPLPALTAAPAPSKPMTWASRLAASTGGAPRPVVPLKAATPPAPAHSRAPAAPAQPTQPAQSSAAPAAPPAETAAAARKETDGWQTAGENSKRQNRPQSMAGTSGEKESTSCYVKYVSEKVKEEDLRHALSAHGDITYFDINRQKNCAFVDFATPQGFHAAIAASPYTVNNESIIVEPRRRSGGYGSSSYGPNRGGMSGRGRGGFDGGRSGSQRGSFGAQGGRGRGSARGPRGAAANAS